MTKDGRRLTYERSSSPPSEAKARSESTRATRGSAVNESARRLVAAQPSSLTANVSSGISRITRTPWATPPLPIERRSRNALADSIAGSQSPRGSSVRRRPACIASRSTGAPPTTITATG